MEGILFIFIFIAVMVITAVLFGVWIIFTILRVIGRMVFSVFAPPRRPAMANVRALNSIRCRNERCHATNPINARFCRRCGQALETQRVSARRAAMW